ncbi:unnamed protein product [Vicia faba]|uniref:Cytochrome P450 n=1 Tax=Vicia faba TaxID=3906 RepID=A0AAV0ZW55_VICFA|nr:unnamed protein product [Vicia faba]
MFSLLFLLLLCLIFPLLIFFHRHGTTKNLPPGPKGLPIIGNLHQLDISKLYLQLSEFSKIYGPIFSLQLGFRQAIVVSSGEIAKEVLKNKGDVFSNRPMLYSQQKLTYNGSEMVFAPYGEVWRELRKICVFHIFSSKRVSYYSCIRKIEVKKMIKKISEHASCSSNINLSELLISLSSTIICRIAFGKSYEDEGHERSRFHGLLHEFQALLAEFFVADYIPYMGWIDKVRGLHGRVDRCFNEFDEFYQEIIDQHLDPNREHGDEDVIVDVLLKLKKQNVSSIDLTFDHIKGVLVDMLVAATDTTSATSVWTLTALIKNPRVMNKLQEEIRSIGVIKETLRLYLPAPLLVPRESSENCTINGYNIPANTILYVNAWAIQRDSDIWKNSEEFYPERFLENSISFLGQNFELIPFGAGHRICPGLSMAVASIELILANLLYSFDWKLPHGLVKEDIDTEMLTGITQHKKNPLYLVAKSSM